MYTKLNLLPAKIASKNSIKPELNHVMFDGTRTVATDSFRLLEVSAVAGEKTDPVFIDASIVKKHKVPKSVDDVPVESIATPRSNLIYPDIDKIMSEKSDVEYVEATFNAELLGELLLAMKTVNSFKKVTLRIPMNQSYEATHLYAHTEKFAWVENDAGEREKKYTQTAHGLIMPIMKK